MLGMAGCMRMRFLHCILILQREFYRQDIDTDLIKMTKFIEGVDPILRMRLQSSCRINCRQHFPFSFVTHLFNKLRIVWNDGQYLGVPHAYTDVRPEEACIDSVWAKYPCNPPGPS